MTKVPSTQQNPCFQCEVSCCSEYTIYITLADALLIHQHLQVPLKAFVEAEPLCRETRYYRPYSFLLGEKTRYLLKLKKRGNFCLFLLRLNRQGRCGIHGFRPAVCRCYPFGVEGNRAKEVPEALCPTSWNLSEQDEKEFLQHYQNLQSCYAQSQPLLDLWNQTQRRAVNKSTPGKVSPQAGFLKFLQFLTENHCQWFPRPQLAGSCRSGGKRR